MVGEVVGEVGGGSVVVGEGVGEGEGVGVGGDCPLDNDPRRMKGVE